MVRVNIIEHPLHAGIKLFTNNAWLTVPTPLLATFNCAPISQMETCRHRAAVREVTTHTGLQPQLLGAGGCSKMARIGAWINSESSRRMGPGQSQEVMTEEQGCSLMPGWDPQWQSRQARLASKQALGMSKITEFGKELLHEGLLSAHPRLPGDHSQSLCSQGAGYGSRKLGAQQWTGLSYPWLRVWSIEAEGVSPDSKEGKKSFL